ncbi:putative neural-cadherin 2 [Cherax quadricarinatus]|uniref:putative neural-cadherin 2 n=1 Tax=Cherax quadricarinatus TaxID=27406 RepID=UPI00387EC794
MGEARNDHFIISHKHRDMHTGCRNHHKTHLWLAEIAVLRSTTTAEHTSDAENEGKQGVDYRVLGAWGALTVDGVGGVRLWRALDREAPGGDVGMARVVAMDEGIPPLSATATLTLTVTDVNDCSPRLLPPTQLQVMEGAPASRVGLLTATDDDLWELGHGPPFSFSLAPSNPVYVLTILTLKYDAGADEGRGGAEVWTTGPLDREEQQQVTAEVVLSDAEGLSATYPITIIVGDLNDNPMRPATKTVYLWKTQSGTGEASLGRVYVEDPDDWDLKDKTFAWEGSPHPLFTLQPDTGNIYASTQLREGRYELHFSVSDRVWGQKDVAAKVVVSVRYLSLEALSHAVPLTLTPTTPAALTTGWTPTGNVGGLSTLTEAVMYVVGDSAETVEVVSVYGLPPRDTYLFGTPIRSALPHAKVASDTLLSPSPFVCVWLSVRLRTGGFMNPVKLHGLLGLHLQHMPAAIALILTDPPVSRIPNEIWRKSVTTYIIALRTSLDTPLTSNVKARLLEYVSSLRNDEAFEMFEEKVKLLVKDYSYRADHQRSRKRKRNFEEPNNEIVATKAEM